MPERQKPSNSKQGRKYAKEEVVFIRCRVVNYDFDTTSYIFDTQATIQNADRGEYLLETISKMGKTDNQSRLLWITGAHLVSLEEAKRSVQR